MGPNVAVLHVDDKILLLVCLYSYFFYFLFLNYLKKKLFWLENFIFFDFLVRQCMSAAFTDYVGTSFKYSVFFCIFYFFLPAASFLNAALCWSICVWILNKSPKRHLPRGFLFRSIHSPPFYACMS